jgi:ribosome-binding protein aMBF1 (putative translation factor)
MTRKTCAACDGELDDNPIQVKIRGRTVEVCCEDCAAKLNEAEGSADRETSLRAEG